MGSTNSVPLERRLPRVLAGLDGFFLRDVVEYRVGEDVPESGREGYDV